MNREKILVVDDGRWIVKTDLEPMVIDLIKSGYIFRDNAITVDGIKVLAHEKSLHRDVLKVVATYNDYCGKVIPESPLPRLLTLIDPDMPETSKRWGIIISAFTKLPENLEGYVFPMEREPHRLDVKDEADGPTYRVYKFLTTEKWVIYTGDNPDDKRKESMSQWYDAVFDAAFSHIQKLEEAK